MYYYAKSCRRIQGFCYPGFLAKKNREVLEFKDIGSRTKQGSKD